MTADDLPIVITPLAVVAQRRRHIAPQDHRTRFEDALVLGEGLIKWSTLAAVSVLAANNDQAAHRHEYELVRADSIGTWVRQLQSIAKALHRSHSKHGSTAKALARHFTEKVRRPDGGDSALWRARDLLVTVIEALDVEDFEAGATKKSCLDVFADFTFLRNRTRGHGAKRAAFYEANSQRLQDCIDLLLNECLPRLHLWTFLRQQSPTAATMLRLVGANPSDQFTFEIDATADRNSLFWSLEEGDEFIPVSRLAHFDSARDSFWLANGTWREASLKGEFINYATGATSALHVPQYGGPRPAMPKSHTAAGSVQFAASAIHTIPSRDDGYVQRPALEAQLTSLLCNRTHRILTLKGPGGIGKTSLAIHVLHELAESADCSFDLMVWLSARDVDLLTEGPAARRRDVSDIESMAEVFCNAIEIDRGDNNAREIFVDHISDAQREPILLVVDNFETLDDPEGVHRFLDEHVILPSKLLITSRHKTYKGDFPVDVPGMEDGEARQLLLREGRLHFCEPRITAQAMGKIIAATSARPYAMRLAVAQIAHGGETIDQALARVLNREDLLDALFERSYALLSDDGRYLYNLIGALEKACPELIIRGLMTQRRLDFFKAIDEVTRFSLVHRGGGEDKAALLDMPLDTRIHANRELIGSPDELSIREDIKDVAPFLHHGESHEVINRFFDSALRELRAGGREGEERGRLMDLCERCANGTSDRWLRLAAELECEENEDDLRRMYKRAAQLDPLSASVWRTWSEWEGKRGDRLQAIYKGIRAIEIGEDDIYFCSHTAGQLLAALREPAMKERFPPHRRDVLVAAVRFQLQRHRDATRLNADGLGKLGWLYLIEYSSNTNPDVQLIHAAKECAEEGLCLEDGHNHCERLYEKCKSTLTELGVAV